MTIIALPSNHEHLAHALVRDLGFTRVHVDQSLRDLALKLDPLVSSGQALANMGRSPRLSWKLEDAGGDWDKAIKRTPEIGRFLGALRSGIDWGMPQDFDGDAVVVGVDTNELADECVLSGAKIVAIAGRATWDTPVPGEPDRGCRQINYVIPEGGVLDHEAAIVSYVRSLRSVENAALDELDALPDTGIELDPTELKEQWHAAGAASWQKVKDGFDSAAIIDEVMAMPEHADGAVSWQQAAGQGRGSRRPPGVDVELRGAIRRTYNLDAVATPDDES